MIHSLLGPARILALAAAAAIGIAAALSLAGGASAQTLATLYIGIAVPPSSDLGPAAIQISSTDLTTGATSSADTNDDNELNAPTWSSGSRYLFFAVPDSEDDINTVHRTGVALSNLRIERFYPVINGDVENTMSLSGTAYKIWRTWAPQPQTLSGVSLTISQQTFAQGCRTLEIPATATTPRIEATGDASLPVCPDNDRAANIAPIQVTSTSFGPDPEILTIWTSGPGNWGREIEDYYYPVCSDPSNVDANGVCQDNPPQLQKVEGRGRYVTGADRRNDLFIRLRHPDTGNPLTYGQLPGIRVFISPDQYFVQNFAASLYSGSTGEALHAIDHPHRTIAARTSVDEETPDTTVPLKICSTLQIPAGATGSYIVGQKDTQANGENDDIPFSYDVPTTPACVIDASEWRVLTGTDDASNGDLVPDLHLQFSIPSNWEFYDTYAYVGVQFLTSSGTCTVTQRQAKICDTAVSTWYQTDPYAYIYRINSLGNRCPVYQPLSSNVESFTDSDGNTITPDEWWQQNCELNSVTDDPFTGAEAIKIGFTLLDDANFDADPAATGSQAHPNIVRWDEFDRVVISAEHYDATLTDYFTSGQFRFLRRDGTKSPWRQTWELTSEQLRAEALGTSLFTGFENPGFLNFAGRWFDAFPEIEYVPTHEATAQLKVEFFRGTDDAGEPVSLSDTSGFVYADELPDARPRIRYLSDGRVGIGAALGDGLATYHSLSNDPALAVTFLSGAVSAGEKSCDVAEETVPADAPEGAVPTCDLFFSRQEAHEAAGGTGEYVEHALVKPIPLLYFPAEATDEQTMAVTVYAPIEVPAANPGDDPQPGVRLVSSLARDDVHVRADGSMGLFIPEPRPVFSYGGITGTLENDADNIAAPGEQVAVTIGFQINAGADEDASAMICTSASVSPCRISVDPANSYLALNGPALWETGSNRLNIDGNAYKLACSPTREIVSTRDFGTTCYVVKADGEPRPKIVVNAGADEDVTIAASFTAVAGGTFQAFIRDSADDPWVAARLRSREFGSYTLTVKEVKQLSSIALSRARPGSGANEPTTSIPITTEDVKVYLRLVNENNLPSELSSISSITVTAIGGGRLSGYNCSERTSCTLRLTAGSDATEQNNIIKAAEKNPALPGAIEFSYDAPSTAGQVTIRAVVVGKDGTRLPPETLALTISGSAVDLALNGAMPRLHSSATDDDRDQIEIKIAATDTNGNTAPLPISASVEVAGVGGAALPTGSHTAAISCDESRFNCKVRITVTAGSSDPLDSGAYTATVKGPGLSDAQTMFSVAGAVDSLSLQIPEELGLLGNTVGISAHAVDRDGIRVADGTWITFKSTATRGSTGAAAALATPIPTDHDNDDTTPPVRRAQTKNGEAPAVIAIVGNGVSILSATADNNKSINAPIDTTSVPAYGEEAIAYGSEEITFGDGDEAATGMIATYRGVQNTSASAVLDLGPDSATVVWLWNGVEWIRYGESDGAAVPGSVDFTVLPGDTILFGSGS